MMKAIDLRVREETLNLTHALVVQRGLERATLLREALDIGMMIIAASGATADQSASDVYETLTGVRLAQCLRPCAAALLDFLGRYGAAPLMILPAPSPAPTPPVPAGNLARVSGDRQAR
jgi:hypothetical protein